MMHQNGDCSSGYCEVVNFVFDDPSIHVDDFPMCMTGITEQTKASAELYQALKRDATITTQMELENNLIISKHRGLQFGFALIASVGFIWYLSEQKYIDPGCAETHFSDEEV